MLAGLPDSLPFVMGPAAVGGQEGASREHMGAVGPVVGSPIGAEIPTARFVPSPTLLLPPSEGEQQLLVTQLPVHASQAEAQASSSSHLAFSQPRSSMFLSKLTEISYAASAAAWTITSSYEVSLHVQ